LTLILVSPVFALLGWLCGVAINHAADILPTRKPLRQRLFCLFCDAPQPALRWSEWVAQLSGHRTCPNCGQSRLTHLRSLIAELAVPAIFLFLLWRYGLTVKLGFVTLYTLILALVTVTDLEHRLIFNVVILPSIALAIAAAFFTPGLAWPSALVGGVFAFGVSYLAALVARGGLGEGDVTLSTFLGFILGFPHIILSLTFGVFLGGFVALLMLLTGRAGMKTFIPYGPFLTITGWIMLVWGDAIWKYYFF
jgi:prepilin signal peptidase PulO-like enzyme (type II secretory pathway)